MSADRSAATPTRTCVGCGRRDRQSAMLRLRGDGEGRIVPANAVPGGRSAYVHATGECVRGIVRSKGLGKSLRQNVAKETRVALAASLEEQLGCQQLPAGRANALRRETTADRGRED